MKKVKKNYNHILASKKESIKELLNLNLKLLLLAQNRKKPIKKDWQTGQHLVTRVDHYYNNNIGVLCGARIGSKYLIVVDEDPRNGGSLDDFKKEIKLDDWPQTFCVKTGNGGRHLYYASSEELHCTAPFKGIDIKGVGGQVVAPSSIHPDTGVQYKTIYNPEYIEIIPDELLIYLKNKKQTSKKINLEDDKIYGVGERHNFLVSECGRLKRAGVVGNTLKQALLAIDKTRCNPSVQENDLPHIEQILKSSNAWDVVDYGPKVTLVKYEPQKKTTTTLKNSVLSFEDDLVNSQGLINEIAQNILDSSQRAYPQFALAAALAIVSACAQGSYTAPHLYINTQKGSNLSLYQLITAPASGGKNHYLSSINKYLYKVNEALLASDHGSLGGMLTDFFAFNSRLSLIDEIQDYFAELNDGRNQFKTSILKQIKELYNGLEYIQSQVTKTSLFPQINNPYFSFFGAGTTTGLNNIFSGNIIGGGLLSRFIIWPHVEIPKSNVQLEFNISKSSIEKLKNILKTGRSISFDVNYLSSLRLITKHASSRSKEEITHAEAVKANKRLRFDHEARAYMIKHRQATDIKYRSIANSGGSEDEFSTGSIIDRSHQMIIKVASLQAIARSSIFVSLKDCEWAECLINKLLKINNENITSVVKYESNTLSILRALKKQTLPINLKELRRFVTVKKSAELHTAILDCVINLQQVELLNHENKAYVLNEAFFKKYRFKIPHNCKIVLKK